MLKRPKIKILILLITIIIIGSYFFIISLIGNPKFSNLKSLLNVEQKKLIKKYIFPYKLISQQQQTISQQQQTISQLQQKEKQIFKMLNLPVMELEKKSDSSEITTEENIKKLSINKTLKKYNLNSGFYAGINNQFPAVVILTFIKVIY